MRNACLISLLKLKDQASPFVVFNPRASGVRRTLDGLLDHRNYFWSTLFILSDLESCTRSFVGFFSELNCRIAIFIQIWWGYSYIMTVTVYDNLHKEESVLVILFVKYSHGQYKRAPTNGKKVVMYSNKRARNMHRSVCADVRSIRFSNTDYIPTESSSS